MTTAVWKLVLAYDGTNFHGWQIQPGWVTVQGELRAALARVTGENVLPQGSGRTDAGVHALGQVASCALAAPIPARNLVRALNRTLPQAIRVLSASQEQDSFHARHSATAKTYEYRIYRGEICPPWQAPYVYAYPPALDLEAMQAAAARLCGTHDFSAFAATDADRTQRLAALAEQAAHADRETDVRGNIRTLHDSRWLHDEPNHLLLYRVTGSGFLHHMVRTLVGTFLEVGRGNLEESAMVHILESRTRSLAGPNVPARGLFLTEVTYAGEIPYPNG